VPQTQREIEQAASKLLQNKDTAAAIDAYTARIHSDMEPAKGDIIPTANTTGDQSKAVTESTAQPIDDDLPLTVSEVVISIITLITISVVIALILRFAYRSFLVIWVKFTSTASTCSNNLTHKAHEVRALWFLIVLRGRLLVRAATYIMALQQDGATTDSANRVASSIDSFAANKLRSWAMTHVYESFSGSRLALISEARLRGFNG